MKRFVFILLLTVTVWASAQTARDCSTLKYKRHKSAWLCGEAHVCTGDICGRPTDLEFDSEFDVVLRDDSGRNLESKKLSYEKPKFCFQGRANGDYELAFVLYKKGVPQPARVFPTRYKRDTDKPNDVYYMVDAVCPER